MRWSVGRAGQAGPSKFSFATKSSNHAPQENLCACSRNPPPIAYLDCALSARPIPFVDMSSMRSCQPKMVMVHVVKRRKEDYSALT
jgi:hypothetical protein